MSTLPFGSSAAACRLRRFVICSAVAVQVSVAGSYISPLGTGNEPFVLPPTSRTLPLAGRNVAVWSDREPSIAWTSENCLVEGSYSSADWTLPGLAFHPPAIRTFPPQAHPGLAGAHASKVAVCCDRAVCMSPLVALKLPAPPLPAGSNISAVASGLPVDPLPPATRTVPLARSVAV